MAVKENRKRVNDRPRTRAGTSSTAMPTSAEMRTGVYVIISAAGGTADPMVKCVLAGQAFALAQRAQLRSWIEAEAPARPRKQ